MLSQVLTLYTTPVVYLYLDRLGNWLTGRKPRAETPTPPTTESKTGLSHEST